SGGDGSRTSAEKNSFNEVAAKLDTGGNFYLYISTEKLLEDLSTKLAGWRGFLTSLPQGDPDSRDAIGKAFDIASNLIKDCGIEDISGLGMSSIATGTNFYHSKTFLHHYEGKGAGFLWKLFGAKSHALAGLDLLPSTTALAFFSDFDTPLLWSV